jgi:type IV pilus assembly protein PilC
MKKNTNNSVVFNYIGTNKYGHKIKGTIEARSIPLAKVALQKQGIITEKVFKKRAPLFIRNNKKIKASDISVFSRQLATLIEAGIPLAQAFDIVAKGQSNKQLKTLIEQIKHDIETGLTLAEALCKRPVFFNKLFCNLVDAGEKSGSLDIMLDKIASYKEQIETIKKKIKKTLTYPIAVMLIALSVTIGMLIFVVPQFEELFKSFDADLPAMTRAVVTLSKLVQSYWYGVLGMFVGAVYAFIYAKNRSSNFAQYVDKALLKIPVLGSIIAKATIARFSRTLSITFAAGLPLVEALKSVAGATGNTLYAYATEKIRDEISTGQQMHKAMENTHLFPNMVVQMVAIGEESGTLEKMLNKVADLLGEDIDNAIDSLNNLLEPAIMIFLGILVGGLVVAMYLPIFKLGAAI